MHVLVVDDELLIRWSIAETLGAAGYTVSEASDGSSALDAVKASLPDVVLLDYRLPDSDDLTLLARIRQIVPAAIVIMMTAFGTPEMVRHAIELGAREVVNKPFNMRDLLERVRTVAPTT